MEPALHALLTEDRRWMKRALKEAERAWEAGEVPIGAVVVRRTPEQPSGVLVGTGRNSVEALRDVTAHAEMLALTSAMNATGDKYLADCTLYVTLEPCPMCAGATVWAKVPRVVFGAMDEKAGAMGTLYPIGQDARLNHRCEIVAGVMAEESAALLRAFFAGKRL
ncbi:MAG: nucleoside deaminase [Bacteroidetes bacterium]|nr:nucleoside deaminase [Bacteroidota bacterium]